MEEQEIQNKKKKSNIIVIICVVVMIIAILGAIAAIAIFGNRNKEIVIETVKTKDVEKSAYRISGNGIEDFDLYFLQLENNKENKVYSPLSIKYALAMLNEGTDGTTRAQITNVLGEYKAKKYNNNEHMSFANAMFIRDSYKETVKSTFTQKLNDKYGAEIVYDPFENASNLNSWVDSKTFKLINEIVDDNSVSRGDFFIINALAIDMNWVNRIQHSASRLPEGMSQKYYHVNYTHENYNEYINSIENEHYPTMKFADQENIKSVKVGASFNHYDIISDLGEDNIRKTVTAKYQDYLDNGGYPCEDTIEKYIDGYMKALSENYKKESTSTDFSIYVDDEVNVFAKDLQTYDGTTLQYVGIMPKEVYLDTYIKEMNAKSLNTIIQNLKTVEYDNFEEGVVTRIRGQIPLFNYSYKLDLMGDLKQLGITDVFDEKKADLSRLASSGNPYIFEASHKATVEFSNDGIKAAAATAVGGAGSAGCPFEYKYDVPIKDIDITFDKPYMFLIRDKKTGEIWFMGTVYNPSIN